jgi:hypothetical protein
MANKNPYKQQKHSDFGWIYEADTFLEFTSLVQYISKHHTEPRFWRGQSSSAWRIEPGATRRIRPYYMDDEFSENRESWGLEDWVRHYEPRMLSQARELGYGVQDGRDLTDLELLALIQHYGGATRLMDFTHNIFSALWFACYEKSNFSKSGLVVGFDNGKGNIKKLTLEEASSNINSIIELGARKCFLWEPAYVLPRMYSQQSLFIFSYCHEHPATTLPISSTAIYDNPDLICISITPNLKKEMLTNCETWFGYTERTMFPGLQGFSKSHGVDNFFERGFLGGGIAPESL